MGLLGKFFKKEEKTKGGCCSFNLEDEIAKVNGKEEKKSSCCDFNLDAEIEKANKKDENSNCGCRGSINK